MRASIHVALQLRYVLLVVFFAGLGATAWMYRSVPTGFIPQEDQGYFMVMVQAPPGSSLSYTTSLPNAAEAIIAPGTRRRRIVLDHWIQLFRQLVKCGHDVCEHEPALADTREKGQSTAEILEDVAPQAAGADVYAQRRAGGRPSSRRRCRAWAASAAFNSCCRTRAETR